MSNNEIKLSVSPEDFAFLRFQGVKHNMSIPSVIKKLIRDARGEQDKGLDLGTQMSKKA